MLNTVGKTVPSNLKLRTLAGMPLANQANLQAMRDATVVQLITGKWAVNVSIEAYMQHQGCLEKLPMELYDPFSDLSERCLAECSEIGKEYRILRYHSTLATYEQGERHDWALCSVVPMLSDMVIIPKKLDERSLRPIMSSFCRASRKCLSDSLILAEGERCKEIAVMK
jgi:hypothetical protein